MKRLLFLLPLFALSACNDEESAKQANASTFLRYFGSEYSHTPNMAIEHDDGFFLLSTIDIPTDVIGRFQNKVKLIKTDHYGNLIWEQVYPAFSEDPNQSIEASAMMITDDAIVVIGEHRDLSATSTLTSIAVVKIGLTGELVSTSILTGAANSLPDASLSGKAIARLANENYLILSSISNSGSTENILVSEVLSSDPSSPVWTRKYGDGTGTVARKIFVNAQNELIWGGSAGTISNLDARLVRARSNDVTTLSAIVYTTAFQEVTHDICAVLGGASGFAIVGSTNETLAQTGEDIFVLKVSPTGEIDFSKTIDFNGQNDAGMAISPIRDGGVIVAANGATGNSRGFGQSDIVLIRFNGNGEQVWNKNFGASAKDEAASVIQTADDGYLVFGSTEFGTNFRKLVLLKVDTNGEL